MVSGYVFSLHLALLYLRHQHIEARALGTGCACAKGAIELTLAPHYCV
jgi:hypothetical protein